VVLSIVVLAPCLANLALAVVNGCGTLVGCGTEHPLALVLSIAFVFMATLVILGAATARSAMTDGDAARAVRRTTLTLALVGLEVVMAIGVAAPMVTAAMTPEPHGTDHATEGTLDVIARAYPNFVPVVVTCIALPAVLSLACTVRAALVAVGARRARQRQVRPAAGRPPL
jgi:hypothetical protein